MAKPDKQIEAKSNRLETLVIEYVPISAITPNAYNPNRQSPRDFELLKRSMREDGFDQPVIVQKATNEIVDGEHRWRAARELSVECALCEEPLAVHPTEKCADPKGRKGFDPLPVVFVNMTPEQMRISTLRHNRARGNEDFELSTALLRDLRELGALDWAQDSLMLDDRELARLLDDTAVPEVLSGYEFGEAWEPGGNKDYDVPTVTANVVLVDSRGQAMKTPVIEAASPAAADRMAAAAELIAAGGTNLSNYDRQMINWSREVFKLSVTFSGAEAAVVRKVLGDQPAVALAALCREYRDSLPDSEWEARCKDVKLPFKGKLGESEAEVASKWRDDVASGMVPQWENERDEIGMPVPKQG